jgi:hypothetical protein
MRKPTPEESPAALIAFEDYWELGDTRSLTILCDLYRQRAAEGKAVPTTRLNSLKVWSSSHNWQGRCCQRIEQEAADRRRALKARKDRLCDRVLDGLEVSITRRIDRLKSNARARQLVATMTDLDKAVRLACQIAGEPLLDKQTVELTGAGGGPVQVDGTSTLAMLADPKACALASELIAVLSGPATEPDHEPEGPEPPAAP